MANVAVIGAGPMGLAAAWELCKAGHAVTVYEADKVVGGMSASFDFDGERIERFYHFICTGDTAYFALLEELGIADRLRWRATRMGYFHDGRMHEWGNPLALLRFPGIGLLAKIRYGLMAFTATKRRNWRRLEHVDAVSWLTRWLGPACYDVLWRRLFELKFHHFTPDLSAAWIWARLRRTGTSRRNLMEERLGYLEGGTDTFLEAILAAIRGAGGSVLTGHRVDEVLVEDGRAQGVRFGAQVFAHDALISTVPLPFVPAMIPALASQTLARYRAIDNIAVVCVLAKLAVPYSDYFWLNISDEQISFPGVIEYSNLRPCQAHVLYVPFYLPGDHEDYARPDGWFIEQTRRQLLRMNPRLREADILTMRAGRYRYAQPICPPGFLDRLPPVDPGVRGLLVADTSHCYPEDRSVHESVKLGAGLARALRC